MHQALLAAMQSPAGVVLDLAGVEQCDAAAVQLLCSARQTAVGYGKRFRLTGLSEALIEAIGMLGLPLEELAEFDPRAKQGGHDAA